MTDDDARLALVVFADGEAVICQAPESLHGRVLFPRVTSSGLTQELMTRTRVVMGSGRARVRIWIPEGAGDSPEIRRVRLLPSVPDDLRADAARQYGALLLD